MNSITRKLVSWYAQVKIPYPWRQSTDPYRVWLSEILLQQTRIPVVLNYYEKFLRRYPDVSMLAKGNDQDFLALWSGLGYYRRAHNMLECARQIANAHRGVFPSEFSALRSLPGIGAYTAGAICNISFNKLTPAIDGNIRRVLARIHASNDDLESTFLQDGAGSEPADYFQALMELGERICLPNPACNQCPVQKHCLAFANGMQQKFPERKPRKKVQIFHWYLLVLNTGSAHYYMQNKNRPFLKNAWIFPDILTTSELSKKEQTRLFRKDWGLKISDISELRMIQHAVTFRKILVHILQTRSYQLNGSQGRWLTQQDFHDHPTSSITPKVLRALKIQNVQSKTAQQTLE